jgi:hypothetical protein
MYAKQKSVREWIEILEGLKKISVESAKEGSVGDYGFISDTIAVFEKLSKGEIPIVSGTNIERVFNLLKECHYYDNVKGALELLNGVSCFRLDEMSKKLEDLEKESGLTGIVLCSKSDENYKKYYTRRESYVNKGGYKRYIFPNEGYDYSTIDFSTNGLTYVDTDFSFRGSNGYIEDARDFAYPDEKDYNYRLLWTSAFSDLKDKTFGKKEELDTIDFELESIKQFAQILNRLENYRNQDKAQLILSTPNQVFQCKENEYEDRALKGTHFNTIRSDGIILDDRENQVTPDSRISIGKPHLRVTDANYVVIATNSVVETGEKREYPTEYVSIIVDPMWYYRFLEYAIKKELIDAASIIDWSKVTVSEKQQPINPDYKVEITPTDVRTSALVKKFKSKSEEE